MAIWFSPSTVGFYPARLSSRPNDCVEISDARFTELMNAQARGGRISAEPSGQPIARMPPIVPLLLPPLTLEARLTLVEAKVSSLQSEITALKIAMGASGSSSLVTKPGGN